MKSKRNASFPFNAESRAGRHGSVASCGRRGFCVPFGRLAKRERKDREHLHRGRVITTSRYSAEIAGLSGSFFLGCLLNLALAIAVLGQSETRLGAALDAPVRIPATRFEHLPLDPLLLDPRIGIGPDEAAMIALYSNPALRAIRDRRGLAIAQVVQAGILPNVAVSYSRDYVTGGNTAGTTTAYNLSAGWEFSALIPFLPKQTAARKNLAAVDLDIAWQEWQIAENARAAVYRVVASDAQSGQAREANRGLQESADAMRKACSISRRLKPPVRIHAQRCFRSNKISPISGLV